MENKVFVADEKLEDGEIKRERQMTGDVPLGFVGAPETDEEEFLRAYKEFQDDQKSLEFPVVTNKAYYPINHSFFPVTVPLPVGDETVEQRQLEGYMKKKTIILCLLKQLRAENSGHDWTLPINVWNDLESFENQEELHFCSLVGLLDFEIDKVRERLISLAEKNVK